MNRKTWVTNYDRQLLERAGRFLAGLDESTRAREVLGHLGLSEEALVRGRQLHAATARALDWEERGIAWNFLSPTPERRLVEARHWYRDARRRHVRECLRLAEEESGWIGYRAASRWPLQKKLLEGTPIALRHLVRAFSIEAFLAHRAELAENLRRAKGPVPADAPPPKDTALAELSGWFERWRLLAQRAFRETPELLAALGLSAGKAPPRLRTPRARRELAEAAASAILARPTSTPAATQRTSGSASR